MNALYLEGTKILEIDEHEVELSYYLTECRKKENKDSTLYGIQIEKRDSGNVEIESSGCITYSKEIVLQMIHKLMENTVTPITLLYIIDDFVTKELCS